MVAWLRGALAGASVSLLLGGCATLDALLPGVPTDAGFEPAPPGVRLVEVRLTERPAPEALADHFCRQELPGLVCRQFFRAGEVKFAFEIDLELENRNPVPVPLVQALVAFRAFPDGAGGGQNLGALCLSLCDDPSTCPQDAADACTSDDPAIRSVEDFEARALGYLVALATGERRLDELRVRTIPANQRLRTVVRLELDASAMLALIERAGRGWGDALRRGEVPDFVIPFEVEGSAWIRVESFGRFAAGFGPAAGRWDLGASLAVR